MGSRSYYRLFRASLLSLVALTITGVFANSAFSQGEEQAVYLQVDQRGTSPMHGSLREFTDKLLRLRLAASKVVKVKTDAVPVCVTLQTPESASHAPPLFYLTTVSLRSRKAQSPDGSTKSADKIEMVLDYELWKYSKCVPTSLLRRSEPFAEEETLSYLDGMANTIGLLLEEEAQARKAVVLVDGLEINPSERAQPIAENLVYDIVARLTQSDRFRPRDPGSGTAQESAADYTIKGKLGLKDNKLTVQFFVQAKSEQNRSYASPVITQPGVRNQPDDDGVRKFIQDASSMAISFLNEVKYAADAGIATTLTPAQLDEMYTKAKAFMCFGVDNCTKQPEAALPLLIVLSRKKTDDTLLWYLLGKAQAATGNYLEAAQAFDKAVEIARVEDPDNVETYLYFSGSRWYDAKNFANAIDRFEEDIKLGDMAGSAFMQLAESYRFLGQRSKAVDTILLGLTRSPDWKALFVSELSDLAETLGEADVDAGRLEQVRKVLQANATDASPAGVAKVETLLLRLRSSPINQ